jgi:dTDP-4-amino-4,6-dideoxygalactose transaminase
LAAIGLRRLRGLEAQLRSRRANAHRLLSALPEAGHLAELRYDKALDEPNYYNLVLTAQPASAEALAVGFAGAGLPPDSVHYGYRPLYHRPIFTAYATECPNTEQLAATTFQLPVHPGMSEAALGWVADRIRVFAEGWSTVALWVSGMMRR